MSSPLANYLSQNPTPNSGFVAYLAALEQVASISPDVAKNIVRELADQRSNLKMIASENYCSLPTQLAMGNLLTDKYAEGIPDHRFYAGCDNVDAIESQAAKLACDLFGADHAYVQPHSGADANMIAFWAILSGARSRCRTGKKWEKNRHLISRLKHGTRFARNWAIKSSWGWIFHPGDISRMAIASMCPGACLRRMSTP